nr:MAG TPA: hypothetical protein [Caudoviricetes sp.]
MPHLQLKFPSLYDIVIIPYPSNFLISNSGIL